MSDRFSLKQKARRRRIGIRIGVLLLFSLLVASAVWVVFFSPWLATERVKISGLDQLTEEQITAAAQVESGAPLVTADLNGIAERVADLIEVEQVDVGREWPQTITIAVQERVAVTWIAEGSRALLVDRHGIGFRFVDEQPENQPQLDADSEADDALSAGGIVAAELAEADRSLWNDVEVIRVPTPDSIELQLSSDRTVVWGSADATEEKVAVLEVLLEIEAAVYDVSAPSRPTTREQ